MRKYKRMIAKAHMKNAGMTKICKHSHIGNPHQRTLVTSYFAKHWKEWV